MRLRTSAAAVVAGLAVPALAACGSSGTSSSTPTSAAAPSVTTTPSSTAASSGSASPSGSTSESALPAVSPTTSASASASSPRASTLVSQAIQALRKAGSAHLHGSATQGGRAASINLDVAKSGNVDGQVSIAGITVQLRRVGNNLYLEAGKQFWAARGLPASAASFLAGKWLKAPSSAGSLTQLGAVGSLGGLAKQLAHHGALTVTGTATVNGRRAVVVHDTSAAGGNLYIEAAAPHYPLKIKAADGTFVLSEFGRSFSITKPAHVVSPQQLAAKLRH